MIDSVLKGTGNSRFLKSAVPAGTSWADALAMLQAGTFPIDFNGINTEGFQQVGTPLNKANLLKDATAAQIGLPPSTTPDGMFQALGNTGELHVWRKTVTNQQAGYNLGEPTKNYITSGNTTSAAVVSFSISDSVSVDDLGNVTQDSASTSGPYTIEDRFVSLLQGRFRGKFVKATNAAGYDSNNVVNDGIWYIPVDAIVSCVSNGTSLGYPYNYCFVIDKMQAVSGHGAGTTTTYPVSTNPNAYQEGDDAKAAGYVLGDVENTTLVIAYRQNTVCNFSYSDALYVADDGNISLANPTSGTAGGSYNGAPTYLSGKFLKFVSISGNGGTTLEEGVVYYIPSNATIKIGSYAGYVDAEIDRYQPVTGYPAIPAGTTIEYLGKLGDKARVQTLSYVGTGTYGSSNPNSLTFDFVPKVIIVSGFYNTYSYSMILSPQTGTGVSMQGSDRGYVYKITCKETDRAVSWYANSYSDQLNASGIKYTAIAIG